MLDPAQPAKVAHLIGGDAIEPARQVLAIEIRQPSMHDDEDLLDEIILFGSGRPERANPSGNIGDAGIVQLPEVSHVDATAAAVSKGRAYSDGARNGSAPTGT